MEQVHCTQCGRRITEDVPNCPRCGQQIPQDQRELLQETAEPSERHRVYIYGRPKKHMSLEVRILLTIILALIIILGVCRITHGRNTMFESCVPAVQTTASGRIADNANLRIPTPATARKQFNIASQQPDPSPGG